jgi:hypothetical protein
MNYKTYVCYDSIEDGVPSTKNAEPISIMEATCIKGAFNADGVDVK